MSTHTPIDCPAGTYNNKINLQAESECIACDPGYYCPAGTQDVTSKCTAGYVCNRGATKAAPDGVYSFSLNVPGACPPGYFCLTVGTLAPDPCPEGSY
jgi:hypothetical protein